MEVASSYPLAAVNFRTCRMIPFQRRTEDASAVWVHK